MSRAVEFVLLALAHCGAAAVRQLAQMPKPISQRWLSAFAQETGLVAVTTVGYRHQEVRYTALTPCGKRYAKGMLGVIPYRGTPAQLVHDLTLAGYYLRLPEEARRTWRNPEQLLASVTYRYRSHYRASYPDGLYQDSAGRNVVVEIAGPKLTRRQIEAKRLTAWGQWNTCDLVVIKAGVYAHDDF